MVTDDEIVKAYELNMGNVSQTCAALKISRRTFYNKKEANKELAERLADVDESLLDMSESKLYEQIQNGNITAILFHLKTKGKNRGYVERQENELSVNGFEQLMKELPDPEDYES